MYMNMYAITSLITPRKVIVCFVHYEQNDDIFLLKYAL